MARTRSITKQVRFNKADYEATYVQHSDGSYEVVLGRQLIRIPYHTSTGRGRFERAGFAAHVGKWESGRFASPKRALAAACKMLRSNG